MQSSTAERRAQLERSRAVGTFAAGTGEGGAEGGREATMFDSMVHSFVLALARPPLARGALTLSHGGPLRSRAELGPGPQCSPRGSPRGAA